MGTYSGKSWTDSVTNTFTFHMAATPVFFLENRMDRGAWRAVVPKVIESDRTTATPHARRAQERVSPEGPLMSVLESPLQTERRPQGGGVRMAGTRPRTQAPGHRVPGAGTWPQTPLKSTSTLHTNKREDARMRAECGGWRSQLLSLGQETQKDGRERTFSYRI